MHDVSQTPDDLLTTTRSVRDAAAEQDRAAAIGSAAMTRLTSSTAYLAEHMGQVPVQVIACITVRSVPPGPGST